jgi:hypothetical protein
MLDLVRAFGWRCVLRVQNQTTVRLRDGRTRPISELAPAPGQLWVCEGSRLAGDDVPIAAFKAAGWRTCNVVAVWLKGETEPWLLLTNLEASVERMDDYAQRWAIERLFLSWKSHGFDLEHVGRLPLERFRRLLSGLVLATLWLLAAGIPLAQAHLARLAAHNPPHGYQFALDLAPTRRIRPVRPRPVRPWAAKFSLFTWGRKAFRQTDLRRHTPLLTWAFPDWDAPRWSEQCLQAYSVTS